MTYLRINLMTMFVNVGPGLTMAMINNGNWLTAAGRWRRWCLCRRRRVYLTSDCSVTVLLILLLQSSSSSSSSLLHRLVDSMSLPVLTLAAEPPTSRWHSPAAVPASPHADFFTVSDRHLLIASPFTLKQISNNCGIARQISLSRQYSFNQVDKT